MGRPVSADFAVIGAGSFGSWTALELARRGYRVVLADAYGPANARASSGGETRIIRMSYGAAAHYSEMSLRSLREWKHLFSLQNEALFLPTGALFTARSGNDHFNASLRTLRQLDIPFEKLSATSLRKRYPQIQFESGTEGLLEPESGVLVARRAVQLAAARAESLGATYVQAAVQPASATRQIRAKTYIYACGPWLPKLFSARLGSRIWPTRQDVFFFGTAGGEMRFHSYSMPAWVDFSSEIYALPDVENRGLKVAFDRHGPAIDPDTANRTVSAASVAAIRAQMRKHIPALADAPILETRVCQYENTSNGEFLIDWLEPGVMAVGGGSGHGFKHGPAVGAYAADLAEGKSVPAQFSLASKLAKQSREIY